jgi:hypothetical protein
MLPRLISAAYVRDFTIRVHFSDGCEGDVDLSQELYGEVFLPLRDAGYFKQFKLNPDLHTIVWPNGADFAPEFLYEQVHAAT